jgi:signal peptidase I
MSQVKTDKSSNKEVADKRKNRAAEIANTFEWLITAFMLAFVFRAFVMEAFRIPTGSMADTLKGAHFQLCCLQCGYKYEYNYGRELVPNYEVQIEPGSPRCPSCGYFLPAGRRMPAANGDRILVLKCIYQFLEPKRWDVVVFKNPAEPWQNFIKRLIARPGEAVEIIDGDIYINGKIARKPPKVQRELWMPVYDNDYQPVQAEVQRFNGHRWRQPFQNMAGSKWDFNVAGPTIFGLESDADDIHVMHYDTKLGNDFHAENYAYNPRRKYEGPPYCSDLMVRFYADFNKSEGSVGIGMSKYGRHYKAWVDTDGTLTISKSENGTDWSELANRKVKRPVLNKPMLLKFANVDHQLIFQFGEETLKHDLGCESDAAGSANGNVEPEVRIFGSGKLALSHIAISRDTYYTTEVRQTGITCFGAEEPFKLGPGEFFVLGDNSPASHDSRLWVNKGIGIDGEPEYRPGIVPHDYLVGKAVFVYWPNGFEFPWPRGLKTYLLKNSWQNRLSAVMYWMVSFRWIPDIGKMRFIYGGSNQYD